MITLTKAAEIAGVDTSTLRRAAAARKLKAQKLGPRSWVTTRKDVQDWIDNPEYHVTAPKKRG